MNNTLKKWKLIRRITVAILIGFLLLTLLFALAIAADSGVYPDDIFGLTKWNTFRAGMQFILVLTGIPLSVDIAMLIISTIKIKNLEQ